MRYSPEIDAARNHERIARGWMSSCWARVSNTERRLKAAMFASAEDTGRIREELAAARRLAIAADADVAGWKRIVRSLNCR
jgi:hypothetical protein